MPSPRKSVDYKQLHSFSSVVLYDIATRSKHRGRFYDVERIITRRKCGSVSLVLFLIRHVFSLESACSSRIKAHVFCVLSDAYVCCEYLLKWKGCSLEACI